MLTLLAGIALPAIHIYAAATATIIAGQPGDGPLVNDIPATSAQFWNPADVVTTSDGTIYVADTSHQEIRSIGADGIIHAAFGDGVQGCGTGSIQTRIWNPQHMVVDEHDNIYVSTACGEVVEFTPGDPVGIVVAGMFDGTGNPHPLTHDGMPATEVTMQPGALAYDRISGALYIYEGGTSRVLKLTNGSLSVFAGTGVSGYSGDNGPATSAQLSGGGDILFADGNLYISDSGNNCRVRMVGVDGNISTIAGNGVCRDENTTGPATDASIEYPGPLAMDPNGMLYIGGRLSGYIYAYDTQTKNLQQVIYIYASNSGLAMEPSGNLLALHTGVNQQLYRVTDLPVPVPPADGKQHGRVTDVSWKVTPTTALWTMDVTVKTAGVSCPAVAVVGVGTWQKRATICTTGQTANNKTINFSWKVYNDNHSFVPGSTPAVNAFVAKSDAAHYGSATTTLKVPIAPAMVGVGDSYISGHHQTDDNIACKRADNLPADDPSCGLLANDFNFSWVTRLAEKLNAKAPTEWKFDYAPGSLLARSGATTLDMFAQGQVATMANIMQTHQDTWNVVAFDGGANDINFSGTLKDFYTNLPVNSNAKPWNVSVHGLCPDSETLYQRLNGTPDGSNSGKSAAIAMNLHSIVETAEDKSNTVRFVNMLYPYVTKTTNTCSFDDTNANPVWHGSASVVNSLNSLHTSLAKSNVLTLNAAGLFGDNPLNKIQQTRYYGYPHPNDDGQAKLAQQAAKLLKQSITE
jgi:hypothetical protein